MTGRHGQLSNTPPARIITTNQPASQPTRAHDRPNIRTRPGRPDSGPDLLIAFIIAALAAAFLLGVSFGINMESTHPSGGALPRAAHATSIGGIEGSIKKLLISDANGEPNAGPLQGGPARTLTITPDCVSAHDIARALHYPGDWRELRAHIDRLNPGLDWGRLQDGQTIRIPRGEDSTWQ